MHKTHYREGAGPACSVPSWHKLDSQLNTITCKLCLTWIADRDMAYAELDQAQAESEQWCGLVDRDGVYGVNPLLTALKHAINCDGGFNDGCGQFFGYADCPFCEDIRQAYGIPSR